MRFLQEGDSVREERRRAEEKRKREEEEEEKSIILLLLSVLQFFFLLLQRYLKLRNSEQFSVSLSEAERISLAKWFEYRKKQFEVLKKLNSIGK